MFVIYDEIRLNPNDNKIELCDMDWYINPRHHWMEHQPTQTVFEIAVDEKPVDGEPLGPGDFAARFAAIRPGHAIPPHEVIEQLGRQAIVLYAVALGYMSREKPLDFDLPDGIKNAYAC